MSLSYCTPEYLFHCIRLDRNYTLWFQNHPSLGLSNGRELLLGEQWGSVNLRVGYIGTKVLLFPPANARPVEWAPRDITKTEQWHIHGHMLAYRNWAIRNNQLWQFEQYILPYLQQKLSKLNGVNTYFPRMRKRICADELCRIIDERVQKRLPLNHLKHAEEIGARIGGCQGTEIMKWAGIGLPLGRPKKTHTKEFDHIWTVHKKRAERNEHRWTICKEDLLIDERPPLACPVLHIWIEYPSHGYDHSVSKLSRAAIGMKDRSKGYVPGNAVIMSEVARDALEGKLAAEEYIKQNFAKEWEVCEWRAPEIK